MKLSTSCGIFLHILLNANRLLLCTSSSLYGSVNFETSCDPSVTTQFNDAVSMYYSFSYTNALSAFNNILITDNTCCIAYYMAASTYTHPIWDYILDDRFTLAASYSYNATRCALQKAVTPREQAYINALAVYTNSSHISPAQRLQQYADSMYQYVYQPYSSSDENAAILYGLSLIAVGYYSESEPADGWPHLTAAGLIVEQVLLGNPASPGALHYVIHAYDQPLTAQRALPAAWAYLNNSLAVPHALHMPSHIFLARGLWAAAVNANELSMEVQYSEVVGSSDKALKKSSSNGGNSSSDSNSGDNGSDNNASSSSFFEYHDSYFLQVGLLQLAMDCDAAALAKAFQHQLPQLDPHFYDSGSLEAVVRVPAHLLIETRNWTAAAQFMHLEQWYNGSGVSVWQDNPWTLIHAGFVSAAARAILNWSLPEIVAARALVEWANDTLYNTSDWQVHQLPYWRQSFDTMVRSTRAWTLFRAQSMSAGIAAMESALAQERLEWAPEAGHVWDAAEQLAEMYLLRNSSGDVQLALSTYESALEYYPNRYHSLAGAGRCAETLKDIVNASYYYSSLLRLTLPEQYPTVHVYGVPQWPVCMYNGTSSLTRRPEIAHAYKYISSQQSGSSGGSCNPPSSNTTYTRLQITIAVVVAMVVGVIVGVMVGIFCLRLCLSQCLHLLLDPRTLPSQHQMEEGDPLLWKNLLSRLNRPPSNESVI